MAKMALARPVAETRLGETTAALQPQRHLLSQRQRGDGIVGSNNPF
jgi:hypothetical protein